MDKKHPFFFEKSRLCLGGRVRLKSRRELKDKIFAKIRKTNVKIIAKNEKRYFLKSIKTNDLGNAKSI